MCDSHPYGQENLGLCADERYFTNHKPIVFRAVWLHDLSLHLHNCSIYQYKVLQPQSSPEKDDCTTTVCVAYSLDYSNCKHISSFLSAGFDHALYTYVKTYRVLWVRFPRQVAACHGIALFFFPSFQLAY